MPITFTDYAGIGAGVLIFAALTAGAIAVVNAVVQRLRRRRLWSSLKAAAPGVLGEIKCTGLAFAGAMVIVAVLILVCAAIGWAATALYLLFS